MKFLLQLLTYPLRYVWSIFFYPPQSTHPKSSISPITKSYIKKANPHSNIYQLYIPGRNEFNFEKAPFLNSLTHNCNIEVIPSPSYYSWQPFSLKKWAEAIQQRIEAIKKKRPDAQITCYGFSLGGAALALSAKKDRAVFYVIMNTFSNLGKLFWHLPHLSIFSFFSHVIPIVLVLTIIGVETSTLLSTVSTIFIIIALIQVISSNLYLYLHDFFHDLYRRVPQIHTPNWLHRYKVTLYPYQLLCKLLHFVLLLIHTPTHYIAHGFIVIQLWLLDCHQSIKELPENALVFQSTDDEEIPKAARLISTVNENVSTLKEKGRHNDIGNSFSTIDSKIRDIKIANTMSM